MKFNHSLFIVSNKSGQMFAYDCVNASSQFLHNILDKIKKEDISFTAKKITTNSPMFQSIISSPQCVYNNLIQVNSLEDLIKKAKG